MWSEPDTVGGGVSTESFLSSDTVIPLIGAIAAQKSCHFSSATFGTYLFGILLIHSILYLIEAPTVQRRQRKPVKRRRIDQALDREST